MARMPSDHTHRPDTALAHSLAAGLHQLVDTGRIPGAVVLVHRHGRTLAHLAVGQQVPAGVQGRAGVPMQTDSVFRIYSMTKPIVSLAVLQCMEQGRLQLSDPVARHLPSFAHATVWDSVRNAPRPAQRSATVYDLLRHTAGLGYAWDTGPVADLYRAAHVGSRRQTNTELVAALGPLPLLHEPGTTWEYSRATDVLGALLEHLDHAPLGEVLARRVLRPLGMHDTGFAVPPAQAHRLAEPFAHDPDTGQPVQLIDVLRPAPFESGGGGLVSTAADYARFTQMLLAGGTLDGQRLIGARTLAFMTADHIQGLPVAGDILAPGHGFGLGVSVRRAHGGCPWPGSPGQYGWSGLGGTHFLVDPTLGLGAVLLTQAPGQLRFLGEWFAALVYGAIDG